MNRLDEGQHIVTHLQANVTSQPIALPCKTRQSVRPCEQRQHPAPSTQHLLAGQRWPAPSSCWRASADQHSAPRTQHLAWTQSGVTCLNDCLLIPRILEAPREELTQADGEHCELRASTRCRGCSYTNQWQRGGVPGAVPGSAVSLPSSGRP